MSQKADDRMGWIRNIEKLRNSNIQSYVVEYEIASEVYIPGLLNYEKGMILCGPMTFEKDHRGLYKYLLKIRFASPEVLFSIKKATEKGYLFKEGIPGELLALFSLYFECRFYMLAAFSLELTQSSLKSKLEYNPVYRPFHPQLAKTIFSIRKRSFTSGLSDFLNQIANLDTKYHQILILASSHYARALREFGVDEEMVFIRLVSAIDAVSKWAKLQKGEDLFNGKYFKEIVKAEALSNEELEELKNLFSYRYNKRRYRRFILQYSKGFFKGGRSKSPHTRIKKSQLEGILDAIYENRSKYLHEGQSMYLSLPIRGGEKWDTDPSSGMIMDKRKFPAKMKLPYGSWFQGLVRHCLLEFIKDVSQFSAKFGIISND